MNQGHMHQFPQGRQGSTPDSPWPVTYSREHYAFHPAKLIDACRPRLWIYSRASFRLHLVNYQMHAGIGVLEFFWPKSIRFWRSMYKRGLHPNIRFPFRTFPRNIEYSNQFRILECIRVFFSWNFRPEKHFYSPVHFYLYLLCGIDCALEARYNSLTVAGIRSATVYHLRCFSTFFECSMIECTFDIYLFLYYYRKTLSCFSPLQLNSFDKFLQPFHFWSQSYVCSEVFCRFLSAVLHILNKCAQILLGHSLFIPFRPFTARFISLFFKKLDPSSADLGHRDHCYCEGCF